MLDRTNLVPHHLDLLMVSLSYRKRAVPLGWQLLRFGATNAATQIALLQQVAGQVPPEQAVVVHGDTEFGAVPMMQF
ncbi:MAG: hypothetical protein F6K39_44030 [Okeania sp. SIO3B3]|nr:hypothetical protein [Okeania sp. SIO3B3]